MSKRDPKLEAYSPTGDTGSIYDVHGRGGGLRHRGYFSDQNPYADDINNSTNNKDIDAAYERAVEWEADWANLQEQRAYDRAVLEEQREYDSPLARLQRDKAAGINSDIAGTAVSGVSGSSAQLAQREIDDQTAQSQFRNHYKDREQRQVGFSNSVGFINSIANLVGSLITGISTIKQTPSRIKAFEAQANASNASANLSNATASEINTLLAGKQELQGIQNAQAIFSQLQNMHTNGLITPDTDISPILTAMGVPTDKVQGFSDAYSQFMKSPRSQGIYSEDKVFENKAEALSDVYTSEYFVRVVEKGAELEELRLDGQILQQSISNGISTLLSNSDYIENTGNALVEGVQLEAESVEFAYKQLQRDVSAYSKYLEGLASERKKLVDKVDAYDKRLKSGKRRDRLNERETIDYEFCKDAIIMIDAYGSEDCASFNSLMAINNRNAYLNTKKHNINGDDATIQNASIYWGQFINGAYTRGEINSRIMNNISQLLGVGAQFYMGKQLGSKPLSSGQTITDYKPTSKGWKPTHQRTTTNNY